MLLDDWGHGLNDKSNLDGLSAEVLRGALEAAQGRVVEMDRQVEAAVAEREAARREVVLLEELVAVRGDHQVAPPGSGQAASAAPPRSKTRKRSEPHPAAIAAVAELERAGRPLHISELMRLLQERGVEIPGSGQQANLIAHLTRHPEVMRPSRGMYALASWKLPEPLKRSKRRRVKGERKRTNQGSN